MPVRNFILIGSILFMVFWVLIGAILSPIVWLGKKMCRLVISVLAVLAWPITDSELVRVSEDISMTMIFLRAFAGSCLGLCLVYLLFGPPIIPITAGVLYLVFSTLFVLVGLRKL